MVPTENIFFGKSLAAAVGHLQSTGLWDLYMIAEHAGGKERWI
jgi:hypothetical protein